MSARTAGSGNRYGDLYTGRPVNRRAAVLIRQDGDTIRDVPFLVSTRKDGNVVMLRLEPVKAA